MTALLASVCNLDEARLALDAGADILDLKDPGRGALGDLSPAQVRRIVDELGGSIPFSATIGDVPFQATAIAPRLQALADCGVDFIKVGAFGDAGDTGALQVLQAAAQQGLRIVLVLFAEDPWPRDFTPYREHGLAGVMLDTRDKSSGGLCDKLSLARLRTFVGQAREQGLYSGLAGSLTVRDIPALAGLAPGYLGFRGALCRRQQRTARLDAAAFGKVRAALEQARCSVTEQQHRGDNHGAMA